MTLEDGDAVPEECEVVGEVPLVLPADDPLEFSDSGGTWAFRPPLAAEVDIEGGIRAYIEGGEADDDDRPRIVCTDDFGMAFTPLRLDLRQSDVVDECVPSSHPFGPESGCTSENGSCIFVDQTTSGTYLPLTGPPGGTWTIVSFENASGSTPGPEAVVYSGAYDGSGHAVGFPDPITFRVTGVGLPGSGSNNTYVVYEWRKECP